METGFFNFSASESCVLKISSCLDNSSSESEYVSSNPISPMPEICSLFSSINSNTGSILSFAFSGCMPMKGKIKSLFFPSSKVIFAEV